MKLDEYKARIVYDLYHNEIEFEFIRLFYLGTLQILFISFTDIPPNIIPCMQQTVRNTFPNYTKNPYNSRFGAMEQLLLDTIGLDMTYKELSALKSEYCIKRNI